MPQKRRPPRKVAKWEDLPLALSLADMCLILDESRETVRKGCANNEIPAIKVRGKWKSERDLFRSWLRGEISCEEAKKRQEERQAA